MPEILKVQLRADELLVGQPLPWAIYGPDGELLLNQGEKISTDYQKYILLTRGVFREATAEEARRQTSRQEYKLSSPFNVLDTIRQHNYRILSDMVAGVLRPDYNQRILKIVQVIQKLCTENKDAILGAILLDQKSLYTQIHPILCAMLTELLLRRKSVPLASRQNIVAAALTQNVGMVKLQESLVQHVGPLSAEQRLAINKHPIIGINILQQHGITNQDWLQAVEQHHEKPDGSGYPAGLQEKDINLFARVLSLADIYSAMVLPRKYRDGVFVKKALREIFLQRGASVDTRLAELLIKEIGVYPPGCFVKLANGDTAIVIHHGLHKVNKPVVLPIVSVNGKIYQKLERKNTARDDVYGIVEVIPRPDNVNINLHAIWGLGSGVSSERLTFQTGAL
jgi:HD-GYP domain-containing protein (c-di-GMP phosphodiesterase class II)